jgi:stearoyl-CoA desaturase (delta-9 desaturase)
MSTRTTAITKPLSGELKNEGEKLEKILQQWGESIRPEMREDTCDPSYQDEEGPPPKLEYVWRNIILMVLLLVGALYGITLVPS